jgi:hypothetical protein
VGAALMMRASQLLAEAGWPKLNLQVRAGSPDAVAFYERLRRRRTREHGEAHRVARRPRLDRLEVPRSEGTGGTSVGSGFSSSKTGPATREVRG